LENLWAQNIGKPHSSNLRMNINGLQQLLPGWLIQLQLQCC
jgi:hypothetical protein